MGKTRIKPFTWSENSIIGCKTGCEYCWARQCAKRFTTTDFSIPIWFEENFRKPYPKKPSRIIVGWMSDIYWWKPEWMERVLAKIKGYPQHTFYFLTKNPSVYEKYDFPLNCWLGITVTKREQGLTVLLGENSQFISIEPLHEYLGGISLLGISWIIIGAETGKSQGKVIPKREWVEDIIIQAQKNSVPVFLKDNLLAIYPDLPRLKEIPNERES